MGILYVLQQQCLIMGDVLGAIRGLCCVRLHVVPHVIHPFINYVYTTRLPIRRAGALQQTSYGSPPACPVLVFPPPRE